MGSFLVFRRRVCNIVGAVDWIHSLLTQPIPQRRALPCAPANKVSLWKGGFEVGVALGDNLVWRAVSRVMVAVVVVVITMMSDGR